MVEGKASSEQGDRDGVYANVHPARILDAVPEVERQANQQTPSGQGSLTAANGGVVQSRPGIVDDEAADPAREVGSLTDDLAAIHDEANAGEHEDGVAQHFEVEAINRLSKRCVRRFERQEAAPGNMLRWVSHAEHVEHGQKQSPSPEENHGWGVDGNGPVHFFRGLVRTSVFAHVLGD